MVQYHTILIFIFVFFNLQHRILPAFLFHLRLIVRRICFNCTPITIIFYHSLQRCIDSRSNAIFYISCVRIIRSYCEQASFASNLIYFKFLAQIPKINSLIDKRIDNISMIVFCM